MNEFKTYTATTNHLDHLGAGHSKSTLLNQFKSNKTQQSPLVAHGGQQVTLGYHLARSRKEETETSFF